MTATAPARERRAHIEFRYPGLPVDEDEFPSTVATTLTVPAGALSPGDVLVDVAARDAAVDLVGMIGRTVGDCLVRGRTAHVAFTYSPAAARNVVEVSNRARLIVTRDVRTLAGAARAVNASLRAFMYGAVDASNAADDVLAEKIAAWSGPGPGRARAIAESFTAATEVWAYEQAWRQIAVAISTGGSALAAAAQVSDRIIGSMAVWRAGAGPAGDADMTFVSALARAHPILRGFGESLAETFDRAAVEGWGAAE